VNVGYYFHLPAAFDPDGSVRVPAWHADVIRGLAEACGTITYFAHHVAPSGTADRTIGPPSVLPVDVGPRRRAPAMSVNPTPTLRRIEPHLASLDALLVRGPTALLPSLVRYATRVPVVAIVMADYTNWRSDGSQPAWRAALIKGWIALYNRQQARSLSRIPVLTVGRALADKLAAQGLTVETVFPSTIREGDVLSAEDASSWRWDETAGRDRPVRLLYSGRLVTEKGIFDAADAVAELKRRGWSAALDLAGWWLDEATERRFWQRTEALGLAADVRCLGAIPPGPALAATYRSADIYVHPTRNEASVAQSLNEAMALHVPTVTTRIRENEAELVDGVNTVLVEPRSPVALADGIESLLRDRVRVADIARGGWEWARGRTLERSCALIADHIRRCVKERATT